MTDSDDAAPEPKSRDEIVAILVDGWNRYSRPEVGSPYDEIMLEIQDRAASAGSLGKSDIGALLLWKRLNLNTVWSRALNNTPDAEVRQLTGEAISQARRTDLSIPVAAREARTTLVDLPGCANGHAVASTLLVAGAPDRMAVYDRRALKAIHMLGLERPDRYSSYVATICDLLGLVNSSDRQWVPRDVDRALFMIGE